MIYFRLLYNRVLKSSFLFLLLLILCCLYGFQDQQVTTTFKIQIAASKKPLPTDHFKDIKDISTENHQGWKKYMVGNYPDLISALRGRDEIVRKGMKGSWIVVYQNGKRISLEKALSTKSIDKNEYNLITKPPELSESIEEIEALMKKEQHDKGAYTNIEEAIKNADNVKELDLRDQVVDELPMDFPELQKLENLNLYGNGLKKLPDEVIGFKDLREVGLGNNPDMDFKDAFNKLAELPNLEVLHLSFNYMKKLPPEIGKLKNLKKLLLFHNSIDSIPPEIGNLKNLEEIGFSYCSITMLPPEFDSLQNLQEIHLLTNNELEVEQALRTLSRLPNLTILRLYDNRIVYLPPIIGEFKSLQFLDLGSNQISFIPKEIENLQNLMWVDLSANSLTDVPLGIEMIPNLEVLGLNFNLLRDFPEDIGPFPNLSELNLSINLIDSCLTNIHTLKRLQKLDLRGNKIPEDQQTKIKEFVPERCRVLF